jgi:hypothetical protein
VYIDQLSINGSFEFLSPENPQLDESQPLIVFGHDCYLVRECDILVVDASSKLGVGSAQEMVIAKHFGKYVYTVLPRDTHHRRSNLPMHGVVVEDWIHPFIFAFSDQIFEDIGSLGSFLAKGRELLMSKPPFQISRIEEAVRRYEGFMKKTGPEAEFLTSRL